MKKSFKFLSLLAVTAILITSCKKDAVETESSKLSLNGATAAVVGTLYSGAFTTPISAAPGSTGDWGTTYFNLENNTTVTSAAAHQAVFNGAWDGVINAGAAYHLAYADVTGTSLAAITLAQVTGATAVSSLGYNTPGPGWYTYNLTTHANAAVENRYVVIYEGDTIGEDAVYVTQLNAIGTTADGSTGKYFGNVSFNFKKVN